MPFFFYVNFAQEVLKVIDIRKRIIYYKRKRTRTHKGDKAMKRSQHSKAG